MLVISLPSPFSDRTKNIVCLFYSFYPHTTLFFHSPSWEAVQSHSELRRIWAQSIMQLL